MESALHAWEWNFFGELDITTMPPPTNLLWDPPKSWREDESTRHHPKRVEWIELLFDLIFVVVIASISDLGLEAIAATLTEQQQQVFHCTPSPGSATPHLSVVHGRRRTGSSNGEEEELIFGFSPAFEKAISTVFYFALSYRVWARFAQLCSSRTGGLDLLGRFLALFIIFSFAGMVTGMHEGVSSPEFFIIVVSNYLLCRFLQLIDYLRLYYHSKLIQFLWGTRSSFIHVCELCTTLLGLLLYMNVSKETGLIMVVVGYY